LRPEGRLGGRWKTFDARNASESKITTLKIAVKQKGLQRVENEFSDDVQETGERAFLSVTSWKQFRKPAQKERGNPRLPEISWNLLPQTKVLQGQRRAGLD